MTIAMMNTEQQLLGDSLGRKKSQLQSQLMLSERVLKTQLSQGIPPLEFRQNQELLQALTTSQWVIEEVWQTMHNAGNAFSSSY